MDDAVMVHALVIGSIGKSTSIREKYMAPHLASCSGTLTGSHPVWRMALHRLARHAVRLGGMAAILAAGRAAAQQAGEPHLTVHPREAATGTHTRQAGLHLFADAITAVYVPAQCVGTRRCPLVFFLQDRSFIESQRSYADAYGMIIVTGAVVDPGGKGGLPDTAQYASLVRYADRVLHRMLRSYAVDPDKIALGGYRGGQHTLLLGCMHLGVFSRFAVLSPRFIPHVCDGHVARGTAAQVYFSEELGRPDFVGPLVQVSYTLRQAGYVPKLVFTLRGYRTWPEDFDQMWRWLSESWATPTPAPQPAPVADVGPLLTTDALTRLTVFWTRFMQEPAAIRDTARQAHQQQIMAYAVGEPFTLQIMDTPAMAAAYPAVAAALKAAGLTAQQADAYRAALIVGAVDMATTRQQDLHLAPLAATSLAGKNVTLMQEHKEMLKALGTTGMWATP